MAQDMAAQAARWAVALNRGWDPEDPRIRESDVTMYVESRPWFKPNISVEDIYQNSMNLLNSPREIRRRFLLHVLHNVSEPSQGYVDLAQLAKQRNIRTLLTTNFDDRFEAAYGHGPIVVSSGQDQHHTINTAPLYPQLVYLHGKAENYMDRIMTDEVQELDWNLVNRIMPLLRDHPLIVVGYRGAEPSVMRSLLLDNLHQAGNFPHGIFWCVLEEAHAGDLSAMTKELADEMGDNFSLVPIKGFDEFMAELSTAIAQDPLNTEMEPGSISQNAAEELPYDLIPAANVPIGNLNQGIMRRIAIEHARRSGSAVPDTPTDAWYESRLLRIGLLSRTPEGTIKPTNAAALLCADEAEGRKITAGHWLEVSTPTRPPMAIDGPLTVIYEDAFQRLEEANRPIRIKGAQSRNEQPYGPIALKEFLANALVHRDYESREPVRIWIDKDFIKFSNPGGLDPILIRQITPRNSERMSSSIGDELLDRVQRGDMGQGFTAYRNPILAEAFWGLGFVDKAGSGLMHAAQSLAYAGAIALLEIPDNNDSFTATVSLTHLHVDDSTNTALPIRPARYLASVTEFVTVPGTVTIVEAKIKREWDISPLADGDRIPPFALRHGKLYTFGDPNDLPPVFAAIADLSNAKQADTEQIFQDSSTQTIISELLKKAVESHMMNRGMRTDRRRGRAYFPCYRHDARSISYDSTRTRERRRVAWWPNKLGAGYCIHTAVNYQITRFGSTWGLLLQPTYIITSDGKSEQLPNSEHARIVTGLLSDHYNRKVLADIRFWLKQLETAHEIIQIGPGNAAIEISTRLIAYEGYSSEEQGKENGN